MEYSLDQVCLGKPVTVSELKLLPELKDRLRDFGLVPGTGLCCRYRSPGKQVTAVECRGAVIAMRTRDLHGIRVRC